MAKRAALSPGWMALRTLPGRDRRRGDSSRATVARIARRSLGLALLLLLVACSPAAGPTPVPTAAPPSQTPVLTVLPTGTPRPTMAPTVLPTPPAPTPAPPPTPRGDSTLLRRADALLADGDYAGALYLYQELLASESGTATAAEALLGTARVYVEMGRPLSATTVLSPSLDAMPAELRHRAHYWLAEGYRGGGDCARAIPFYRLYREEGTTLDDLIAERLAWCYRDLGDPVNAAAEFTWAAGPHRAAADQVGMLEEAAADLRALGSYDQAVARYESILAIARKPWYRAEILFRIGQTLASAGRPQEAQSRWQEALDSYADTAAAARAADALNAAAVPVDPYAVGRAFRAAGRPGEAVAWLAEALRREPAAVEVAYTLAWARAEAGDLDTALAELDALAQAAAADPRPLQERAAILESVGALSRAVETQQLLVERFPGTAAAAEARWQAALLLEDLGRPDEARAGYSALLEEFPDSAHAAEACFRAGLLYYRQGNLTRAEEVWRARPAGQDARLALWHGLALARLGWSQDARKAWAEAADGQDYYAARARELLSSGAGFGRFYHWPAWGDEGTERAAAEQWLAQALGRRVSAGLPAAVRQDPLFARGEEWLLLGRPDEARQPFNLLIDRFQEDGPALYALAYYLREHRLHGLSVRAAGLLSGMVGSAAGEMPAFLLRLRYPTPYAQLIVAESRANGVDPLLFFALVRQESLFDRYATSWAEARGLTQVIPSTGAGIAAALGFDPFRLEDLYRPVVSVRFGTWYLGRQLAAFDNQAIPALAGYNGGPGNARRWAGGQVPVADMDLFVEAVDFAETRGYIERIYTSYWIYRELYGPAPAGPAR